MPKASKTYKTAANRHKKATRPASSVKTKKFRVKGKRKGK